MCDALALEYVQLCRFRIAIGFAEFTVQNGEADAAFIPPNKVPSRKPTLLQCGDDDGFSTALFIFPAVAVETHDHPARTFPIYAPALSRTQRALSLLPGTAQQSD